jgi:hypothetical protein
MRKNMRRWYLLLPTLLLLVLAGCGGSNNTVNNVALYGNWNVAMYQSNTQTAVYVFGLAMSQLGGTNYSGSSIAYDGSVPVPSNMCINGNTIRATATTNGNNFNMTLTDTTSGTIITVTGTLESNGSTAVSGNYTNVASATCPASQGTMNMVPQ